MFGHGLTLLSRLGRATPAIVRPALALLCLLAFFGAPSPVLCLERDGACTEERETELPPGSCHDQFPASIPNCESCTDVATPEESLVRASQPGHGREISRAGLQLVTVAGLFPAPERSSRPHPSARTLPTPSFLRTTVLLI